MKSKHKTYPVGVRFSRRTLNKLAEIASLEGVERSKLISKMVVQQLHSEEIFARRFAETKRIYKTLDSCSGASQE